MSIDLNSKQRFSNRVEDYVKYRPDYPREIVSLLRDKIGLASSWKIADVGCGTGISCRTFLENGNEVFGIEPNDDMRRAAVEQFAGNPRFHPIKGEASATSLPDEFVDLVIVAQAFHWFDKPAAAKEFKRILKCSPGGYAAIIWNSRLANVDEFAKSYDEILHQYGSDYRAVAHRTSIPLERFAEIFGAPFERLVLPNQQTFTLEGLNGRVRSSSYTPTPGQSGHDELFAAIKRIFDQYQRDGHVQFQYETEIFLGRLCNPKSAI